MISHLPGVPNAVDADFMKEKRKEYEKNTLTFLSGKFIIAFDLKKTMRKTVHVSERHREPGKGGIPVRVG